MEKKKKKLMWEWRIVNTFDIKFDHFISFSMVGLKNKFHHVIKIRQFSIILWPLKSFYWGLVVAFELEIVILNAIEQNETVKFNARLKL